MLIKDLLDKALDALHTTGPEGAGSRLLLFNPVTRLLEKFVQREVMRLAADQKSRAAMRDVTEAILAIEKNPSIGFNSYFVAANRLRACLRELDAYNRSITQYEET